MKNFQIKNNIINLEHIRKMSYTKLPTQDMTSDLDSEHYDIELTYSNGDKENYEMTYDKFQYFMKILDTKPFVIDDKINSRLADIVK